MSKYSNYGKLGNMVNLVVDGYAVRYTLFLKFKVNSQQFLNRVLLPEERLCRVVLLSVREKPGRVEDCLDDIVQEEEAQSNAGVRQHVGTDHERQVQGRGADLLRHVFALNLIIIRVSWIITSSNYKCHFLIRHLE